MPSSLFSTVALSLPFDSDDLDIAESLRDVACPPMFRDGSPWSTPITQSVTITEVFFVLPDTRIC